MITHSHVSGPGGFSLHIMTQQWLPTTFQTNDHPRPSQGCVVSGIGWLGKPHFELRPPENCPWLSIDIDNGHKTQTLRSALGLLMPWHCLLIGYLRGPDGTVWARRCTELANEMNSSSALICLFYTPWSRVTHICVGNLTIIGSDNGLSPGRRQAIIWISAGICELDP